MAYIRKTQDEWIIEQYTGSQYGWEQVCAAETYKEARKTASEYKENQPQYPVRFRMIRVRKD